MNQLWLQEEVNNSELEIEKVKGEINRADALTKYKDGESIKRQLAWTSQVITSGRHCIAPKLSNKDPLEEMDEEGDNGQDQLEQVIMDDVITNSASESGRSHASRPHGFRVLGNAPRFSSMRGLSSGTIVFG